MLGSLATKLRILGYDTEYDSKSSDSELLKIAEKTKRILLTSDQEMFLRARRARIKCMLVQEEQERERLSSLFSSLRIEKLDLERKPRCSECNGILQEEYGERDSLGRTISRCVRCGKTYWKGSHWQNLEALFRNVNKDLHQTNMAMRRTRSPNRGTTVTRVKLNYGDKLHEE